MNIWIFIFGLEIWSYIVDWKEWMLFEVCCSSNIKGLYISQFIICLISFPPYCSVKVIGHCGHWRTGHSGLLSELWLPQTPLVTPARPFPHSAIVSKSKLWLMISQPICPGVRSPSGTCNQFSFSLNFSSDSQEFGTVGALSEERIGLYLGLPTAFALGSALLHFLVSGFRFPQYGGTCSHIYASPGIGFI
jgi:hypothetical protein